MPEDLIFSAQETATFLLKVVSVTGPPLDFKKNLLYTHHRY